MIPKKSIAAVLTAASLSFAPVAMAQESQEIPQIAAEDVSKGQVVSFVNAMIAIDGVRREYLPQIEAAETQEDRQELAEQADVAARSAVEDVAGISPAEYLAIGRAAQGSEDLAKRINTRITAMKQKQQNGGNLQQPAQDGTAAQE
ncbi:DUF4168 domain-containing protein [Roseovarius salis]|uniref:DUF4168 domain-containing protein n=1 Tax=Roseovarius salis TaxID=3376063 RepID=UPI0037C667FA